MNIRITYKHPKIGTDPAEAGKYKQKHFNDLEQASNWIVIHIPETERDLVRLWIGETPITGATRDAAIRPLVISNPQHQ